MKKKQKLERRRVKAAQQAKGSRHADDIEVPGEESGHPQPGTNAFKRAQSIKTAKWNRYMLIRYLDAGLFFIGLYWAFMLMAIAPSAAVIVPAIELVVALAVMVEVFTVLSRGTEYLVWSRRMLTASCAISAAAAVLTIAIGPQLLFPFFNASWVGAALCFALMIIKLIIIRCILRVRDRKDKRYASYVQALRYNS